MAEPGADDTPRLLLVEDDVELAALLEPLIAGQGYTVDVAHDAQRGLHLGLGRNYRVMVIDRRLPGMDGLDLLVRLRRRSVTARVLILTALGAHPERVRGLDSGADDYLAKPFDFPVLVARIGALWRRAQPAVPPVLRRADLVVDSARRLAWRGTRRLELAPKEFGVLELLLADGDRTVAAEELLERVWDEAADPLTSAVKITVSRLRAKLGEPQLIETVAKAGYRIGEAEPCARS